MKERTFVFSPSSIFLLILVALTIPVGIGLLRLQSIKSELPAPLPVFNRVQDFTLNERSGKKITLADLRGKVWIADLIFTRCAGICPLMSIKMKGLQKQLAGDPNIRLVSFSVDPEYDTVDILSHYANRFEADPAHWYFLTGDKKEIFNLAEKSFRLAAGEIPAEQREQQDQAILHSSKFVLIDGAGQVRGFYDSNDSNSLNRLIRDARTLSHS